MQIYNTHINFQSSKDNLDDFILIQTQNISPDKNYYCLRFSNNQEREIALFSTKKFALDATAAHFIFEIQDVVSFSWDLKDACISYTLHKYGTQKLLKYWLSHTVFPIYLILKKKYYVFHVGAVMYKNTPLVFMAPSFGGKSTLTDYFLQKGHKLITDDKLITYKKDGNFFALPSYPFHRPYREKESLGQSAQNFETKVQKLQTMYLLKKVDPVQNVFIREVKGIEKFKHLKYGSEMDFEFLFEYNTQYLWKLCKIIKIYELCVPWDLNALKDVYEKIIQHQNSLKMETE